MVHFQPRSKKRELRLIIVEGTIDTDMIKAKMPILKFKLLLFLLTAGYFLAFSSSSVLAADSVSEMLSKDEKNREPCKEFSLTELNAVMNRIGSVDHKNWQLQYKDKTSIIIEEYELQLYACVDLDNDGMTEAVLLHNTTGGMHCCKYFSVHKIKNGKIELLGTFGSERANRAAFRDLNKDGIKEIITFEILDYLEGVDRAHSAELPLIFCYRDNKLVKCTKSFPEIIKKEIDETLKQREKLLQYRAEMGKKYGPNTDMSDIKGNALQFLFLYDRMGKKKEGWQGLKKYYPQVYKQIKKEYGE